MSRPSAGRPGVSCRPRAGAGGSARRGRTEHEAGRHQVDGGCSSPASDPLEQRHRRGGRARRSPGARWSAAGRGTPTPAGRRSRPRRCRRAPARPASRSAAITPIAIWSLAAKIAVTSRVAGQRDARVVPAAGAPVAAPAQRRHRRPQASSSGRQPSTRAGRLRSSPADRRRWTTGVVPELEQVPGRELGRPGRCRRPAVSGTRDRSPSTTRSAARGRPPCAYRSTDSRGMISTTASTPSWSSSSTASWVSRLGELVQGAAPRAGSRPCGRRRRARAAPAAGRTGWSPRSRRRSAPRASARAAGPTGCGGSQLVDRLLHPGRVGRRASSTPATPSGAAGRTLAMVVDDAATSVWCDTLSPAPPTSAIVG